MLFDEVLSIGSKMQKIRKKLGITQKEVEKGMGVSRSQISKLENGESSLSDDNAVSACEVYNYFIDKNNLPYTKITPEELQKDEKAQANDIALMYVGKLCEIKEYSKSKESYQKLRKKIDSFLEANNEYIDSKHKCLIFKELSDLLCELLEYKESEVLNYKAYDLATELRDYVLKVGILHIRLKIFDRTNRELIGIIDSALDILNNQVNDEEKESIFLYSKALYYSKQKDVNSCLQLLKKIETDFKIVPYHISVKSKILEANCYIVTNRYEEAERLYKCCLDIMRPNDMEQKSLVYRNMTELYYNIGNYEAMEKYTRLALEMKDIDCISLAMNYHRALLNYILLDKIAIVEINFEDAINALIKAKRFNLCYKFVNYLLDCFMNKNNYKVIDKILYIVDTKLANASFNMEQLTIIYYKAYNYFLNKTPESDSSVESISIINELKLLSWENLKNFR